VQTAFAIDSVKDTVTTVAAMKNANATLKKSVKAINIDEIEDITDDLADMMEDMNEVNDALGRSYATPDDIDEADLEAELDVLEDEMEADALAEDATPSYLQPAASMPDQPSGLPEEGKGANDEFGLPLAPEAV
jgi:charged multivesicular body protein 5